MKKVIGDPAPRSSCAGQLILSSPRSPLPRSAQARVRRQSVALAVCIVGRADSSKTEPLVNVPIPPPPIPPTARPRQCVDDARGAASGRADVVAASLSVRRLRLVRLNKK